MDIEIKFKTMLLPILGLDSVDEIENDHSLVNDLGADSLDFVELVFRIEREFAIKLETKEIVLGGIKYSDDVLFREGRLTEKGLEIIKQNFSRDTDRFRINMTKVDIFQAINVGDIIRIIKSKIGEKGEYASE